MKHLFTKGHTPANKGAPPRKCDECSTVNGRVARYKEWNKLLCEKHYMQFFRHGKALWGDEKPYKTPEPRRKRYILEQIYWRKAVFERDNYTCQICGVRGAEIQADHIKPYSLYPELRTELANGRTLCVPCHRKTPTWGRNIIKTTKSSVCQ